MAAEAQVLSDSTERACQALAQTKLARGVTWVVGERRRPWDTASPPAAFPQAIVPFPDSAGWEKETGMGVNRPGFKCELCLWLTGPGQVTLSLNLFTHCEVETAAPTSKRTKNS